MTETITHKDTRTERERFIQRLADADAFYKENAVVAFLRASPLTQDQIELQFDQQHRLIGIVKRRNA